MIGSTGGGGQTRGDEYTIEKILDKRVKKDGFVEYLVKWDGYSRKEATWESENVASCHLVIEDFERRRRRKQLAKKQRRLKVAADGGPGIDRLVEVPQGSTMKMQLSSPLTTTTRANNMPTASDFLRDDVTPDENRLNGTGSAMAKGTLQSTPRLARRPNKMRRLGSEEVEDEARSLVSEGTDVVRRRVRSPACAVRESSRGDTPLTRMLLEGGGVEEERSEVGISPVSLPPAPERSALRRQRNGIQRSVRFSHVDVYLFERTQGYHSVPSDGDVCLGMEARHHDSEHHRLDEHMRLPSRSSPRRLQLGEKYTSKYLSPVSPKQRSQMLRTSGVKITKDLLQLLQYEHESIRQGRKKCGCRCEGGRCLPDRCECSRDGIGCQVDGPGGPCHCKADTCQNDQGRVEYSESRIHEHYWRTIERLKLGERMGNDSLPSPSYIRFIDENEAPRHDATSYLATPPPPIYLSPSATPKTLSTPTVISAICPTQLCTPPMQQQAVAGGSRGLDGTPPHTRFPVTPVFKKSAGGGARNGRELSLSRVAIFKAASTASTPVLAEALPASPKPAVDGGYLDGSFEL